MKTNYVPALVTLAAGAVDCVIGLTEKWESIVFIRNLLIVLIVFFVIGTIIKMILDHNFKDFDDLPEENSEENETSEDERDKMESISTEEQNTDK